MDMFIGEYFSGVPKPADAPAAYVTCSFADEFDLKLRQATGAALASVAFNMYGFNVLATDPVSVSRTFALVLLKEEDTLKEHLISMFQTELTQSLEHYLIRLYTDGRDAGILEGERRSVNKLRKFLGFENIPQNEGDTNG